MERYFVAALIVGGLVAIGVGAIRRRGVPPAKFEVEAELVRQGIVAERVQLTPIVPPPLPQMRLEIERQRAAMRVMEYEAQQITGLTPPMVAIAQQQARLMTAYHLLDDPPPNAHAIAQADLAIRRARHPHPPR